MNNRLCIFGEVLFDHFPDGKSVLGGAPFNVAWHLQALGLSPGFISRVGDDNEGKTVRATMSQWGMETSYLQTDEQYPTGQVQVTFKGGEPAYDIVHPCAYDAIEALPQLPDCSFLYHGSLALREETSQQTLTQLMECLPKTVFIDVNLRAPWYELSQVRDLLKLANWVKLNTDELHLLYPDIKSNSHVAADFLEEYQLDGLVLTHGAKGAELITSSGTHLKVQPEQNIEVVDTVGAGDAFASIIILGLRKNWPLDMTLQRAQEFASKLVSNRGATVSDKQFYQTFINQWKLAA